MSEHKLNAYKQLVTLKAWILKSCSKYVIYETMQNTQTKGCL